MGGADHVSSGRYWPVTSVRRGHDNDYENGRDAQPLLKTSLLHILPFQKVCLCYKWLSLYPCSGPFLQQQQQQSLRWSWAWWTLGFGIGLYGTGCSCWTEERQKLRLTLHLNKPQDNLNPVKKVQQKNPKNTWMTTSDKVIGIQITDWYICICLSWKKKTKKRKKFYTYNNQNQFLWYLLVL